MIRVLNSTSEHCEMGQDLIVVVGPYGEFWSNLLPHLNQKRMGLACHTNLKIYIGHHRTSLTLCLQKPIIEVSMVYSVIIVMFDHFKHILTTFIDSKFAAPHLQYFLCSLLLRGTRCCWIPRSSRLSRRSRSSRSCRISRTARTRWATRPRRC